ncbi:ATP-binding protein [uncultured Nocardioides sp.]|uniref:ATP-binding protein n=1 Tax=uncultured Nocardioides sp. TaxID=198441 RepID=UPI0026D1E008
MLTISNPVSSIDQATLERAFDPWFRGSAAADEQAPGSGLGLVIARGLARLMGGDVALRVENAVSDPVGGGARLAPVVHAELTLPLA